MVYLLFFLTGAAGLVYEMSWSRQIGIFFGHTVNAAAVVLAVYFAGMALGYWLAGGIAARLRRPLLGYGVAEIAVGLWAIATPHVLALFKQPALAALLNSSHPGLQTFARVVAAFIVLLPATVALGASLPFVAQHLARGMGSGMAARRSTVAYALNTLGAVCGVLGATFYLILNLGVARSSYLAAGISLLCGIGAILLGLLSPEPDSKSPAAAPPQESTAETQAGHLPLTKSEAVALACVSGFGTLALQVLYTRLFALVFHNSTYSFGGIVAVFLLALALGSWLASRLVARFATRSLISYVSLTGACCIFFSVRLLVVLTGGLQYFEPGAGFARYVFDSLGLIAAVVMLPVTLLGILLPLVWHSSLAGGASAGRTVGRLTALNTLCATAGALLASFAILPLLGIWQGIGLLCGLYAAAALLLKPQAIARVAALPVLLVFIFSGRVLAPDFEARAHKLGYDYVYAKDTPYGRIDVLKKQADGDLILRQNRHYTLGASSGGKSEVRQGLLPLLLHSAPSQSAGSLKVCYLGLATGITAGAALDDPQVASVTTAELIPEVAEAAKLYAPFTNDVTADQRSRIVINDARYYLYATPDKYDVIVSDLFVPWHSQTGYLYTVEHYQAARQRLAPGGLFCQWLPLYQLGPRELELIADSFASVFPHVTLWRCDEPGESPILGLVGSEAPLRLDGAALTAHCAGLAEPYCGRDPLLSSADSVASFYVGDWALRPGAMLNTDEHPRVEFLAPLSQRAGILLEGERLKQYENEVLSKLPKGGFALTDRRL